jgi:hypothetical protein
MARSRGLGDVYKRQRLWFSSILQISLALSPSEYLGVNLNPSRDTASSLGIFGFGYKALSSHSI